LKEKCFGSSSGKDSPVSMSVRVVENQDRTSPCGVSRKQAPLPRRSASASAVLGSEGETEAEAEAGRRTPEDGTDFLGAEDGVDEGLLGCFRSATTTSMSCSL
jgi:hypothetical protein